MARGAGGSRRKAKKRALPPGLFLSPRGFLGGDFREQGKGRFLLRDPGHEAWTPDHPRGAPEGKHGDFTRSPDVAAAWRLKYAAAWENAKIRRQAGIVDVSVAARPLGPEIDAYLASRFAATRTSEQLSEGTYYGDLHSLRVLEGWYGREIDVQALVADADALNARLAKLVADGYARDTVRNHAGKINMFLKSLKLPPCAVIPPGRARRDRKEPWTEAEVAKLRFTADEVDREGGDRGVGVRLALELALATGAREGELFALRWEDLDPARGTVFISRQLLKRPARPGGSRFGPPKGREPGLAAVLPGFWRFYRQGETGLILPGRDGGPVGYAARQVLIRLAVRAGVKVAGDGEGNHKARHTYSRCFLEAGGSIEDLSKSLRHADLGITQRFYGHLRPQVAADRAVAVIYRYYGAELQRLSA